MTQRGHRYELNVTPITGPCCADVESIFAKPAFFAEISGERAVGESLIAATGWDSRRHHNVTA